MKIQTDEWFKLSYLDTPNSCCFEADSTSWKRVDFNERNRFVSLKNGRIIENSVLSLALFL